MQGPPPPCYAPRMPERTIIVGDIHGCLDELRELLATLRLSDTDRLIAVGDLVGKGPDGAGVVRFFREGGHKSVLGNHDAKLLAARRGEGGKPLRDTHRAHADAMTELDWRWLESRPLSIELPELGAIVVHAGLVPGIPLGDQRRKDLLNMRSLRPDGTASRKIEDGAPWASLWGGPERIVFGHDAVRGLQRWPHAIGLDTGCVYGGYLSALVYPEDRIRRQRALAVYEAVAASPTRVCPWDGLDGVVQVTSGRLPNGRPREVIVLKTSKGKLRAYLNRCEHLPIPLDGGSGQFLSLDRRHLACGTHGALFRLDDGLCTEGPCEGAHLEPVDVRVDDEGWIIVDG